MALAPQDPVASRVFVDDAFEPTQDATPVHGRDSGPPPEAPRPLAPMTASSVTTHRPTLRFAAILGADATRVEICADRACTRPIEAQDTSEHRVRPLHALPPGTYYWRLWALRDGVASRAPSVTWEFRVDGRDTPVDSWWGTATDFDGDGLGDVVAAGTGRVVYGAVPGARPRVTTVPDLDVMVNMFAGDVNGDGYVDLVSLPTQLIDWRVSIADGGPDGLTPEGVHTTTLHAPRVGMLGEQAIVDDVTHDGYADLVRLTFSNEAPHVTLRVWHGGPAGLDTEASEWIVAPDDLTLYPDGYMPDYDGDGLHDLLTVREWNFPAPDPTAPDVMFYRGTLTGLPPVPTAGIPCEACWDHEVPHGVGDLDGDGYADAVIGWRSGDGGPTHSVYETFHGGPHGLTAVPGPSGNQPGAWGIPRCDYDGDGRLDPMTVGVRTGVGAHVMTVYPSGSPGAEVWFDLGTESVAPLVFPCVDFDGDGNADLVTGNRGQYIRRYTVDGFTREPTWTVGE